MKGTNYPTGFFDYVRRKPPEELVEIVCNQELVKEIRETALDEFRLRRYAEIVDVETLTGAFLHPGFPQDAAEEILTACRSRGLTDEQADELARLRAVAVSEEGTRKDELEAHLEATDMERTPTTVQGAKTRIKYAIAVWLFAAVVDGVVGVFLAHQIILWSLALLLLTAWVYYGESRVAAVVLLAFFTTDFCFGVAYFYLGGGLAPLITIAHLPLSILYTAASFIGMKAVFTLHRLKREATLGD